MNWNRAQLKNMAKTALRGSYWYCVLAGIVMGFCAGSGAAGGSASAGSVKNTSESISYNPRMGLILLGILMIIAVAGTFALVLKIFVFNPLYVGCCSFFRKDVYAPAELNELGRGYRVNYKNVVKTEFLRGLYTFLWSLLFIIPGIVKSYEYRMIPYLLSEDSEMSSKEAFERSKAMMYGEKWKAFVLDLSFIGWHLLSVLTLGILEIFYVQPYEQLTMASLYHALREKERMF